MSVTFGLAGSSPFQDYSPSAIADLIYVYLGTNWSITTPAHINKLAVFQTTTPAQMINRPEPGNRSVWLWVQHATLISASNDPRSQGIGRRNNIHHEHVLNVNLFMQRLTQGLTFPELDQMSQEVERLTYQYYLAPVTGINRLDNFGMSAVAEATELGEAFAGQYYISCQVTAHYWKTSTA